MARTRNRFNPFSGVQNFLQGLRSGAFGRQGALNRPRTNRALAGPVQESPGLFTPLDRPRTPLFTPLDRPRTVEPALSARSTSRGAPKGRMAVQLPRTSGGRGETPERPELVEFDFPDEETRSFTAGSPPALALTELVNTIAGSGIAAADIYGVIGATPEDTENFMSALILRWQEASAAAFGDPEATKEIFRKGLVRDATPAPPTFDLTGAAGQGGDAGEAPLPADEFDPADFFIDPSLLFSSTTSGEDFF